MTTITGPCAEDPEAFFPASTDHPAIQHAKALCHTCPAQAACLELAMSNEHGNAKGRGHLRRHHTGRTCPHGPREAPPRLTRHRRRLPNPQAPRRGTVPRVRAR